MRKLYSAVFVSRVAIFVSGLALFILKPQALNIRQNFGIDKGLTFVNFVWIYLVCQMMIQIFSKKLGSMGFRKQFECNYKERKRLFAADVSGLRAEAAETARKAAKLTSELTAKATELTTEITAKAAEIVTNSAGECRGAGESVALPWNGSAGDVIEGVAGALKSELPGYSLTDDIANVKELNKGAIKVAVSWLLLNAVIAGLYVGRLIDAKILFLIAIFYGMCDLICVLFYCPFQHLMMKNKCCRTCRIFNWDGIMTVTPLVLVPCAFSLSLIALAAILLIKWEFAFARHPGRFLESKNCTLECKNCDEYMCRGKLNDKNGNIYKMRKEPKNVLRN